MYCVWLARGLELWVANSAMPPTAELPIPSADSPSPTTAPEIILVEFRNFLSKVKLPGRARRWRGGEGGGGYLMGRGAKKIKAGCWLVRL